MADISDAGEVFGDEGRNRAAQIAGRIGLAVTLLDVMAECGVDPGMA